MSDSSVSQSPPSVSGQQRMVVEAGGEGTNGRAAQPAREAQPFGCGKRQAARGLGAANCSAGGPMKGLEKGGRDQGCSWGRGWSFSGSRGPS